MRLGPVRRSARQRALVDGALAAYNQWRGECAVVGNAYRRWLGASVAEKPVAFHEYNAALDREERAARCYARLMDRAGHLAETGLARQLAEVQTSSRRQ